MNVGGVLDTWNEEFESYCLMSSKIISILLLCFVSFKLCGIGFLPSCVICMVCYGYVFLVLSFLSHESA